MNSLKKLQEKISRLEINQNDFNNSNVVNPHEVVVIDDNNHDNNINKANETEIRILKLEEQLEKMRQMVSENEQHDHKNNRFEWSNNKRSINLEKDAIEFEKERFFTERKPQDFDNDLIRNSSKQIIIEHDEPVILNHNQLLSFLLIIVLPNIF